MVVYVRAILSPQHSRYKTKLFPSAKLSDREACRFRCALYRFWALCKIVQEAGPDGDKARLSTITYLIPCSQQQLLDIEAVYLFLRSIIGWTISGSNAEELPMWSPMFGEYNRPSPMSAHGRIKSKVLYDK